MKKALVTGGGGFIGLAVVRELIRHGVEPVVFGRNVYPEAVSLGARSIRGDIRNPDDVITAAKGCDTVFHVAAKAGIWGGYESYYSTNVDGTRNVITACLKNDVDSLVYTSTPSVVFDGDHIEGGDETLEYAKRPLCAYAATKILAERLVLRVDRNQLRTAALRPHLVWGPGDTNLIPRLLCRGRRKSLKVVGNGRNRVDLSYIDNVASVHILAALNLENQGAASGQAFFISDGQPVVLWSWINELFNQVGIPAVTARVPFAMAYAIGACLETFHDLAGKNEEPRMTRFLAEQLAKSHWFSIAKARDILGYSPAVSNTEGMERLVGWLCRQKLDCRPS